MIFPHPVKKNRTVVGHVFYYSPLGNLSNVPDEDIAKYTCISTDSLFSTPTGDYKCIVYRMEYYDFETLFRDEVCYFIKPGLGIVGMIEKIYHYKKKDYWYVKKYVLTNYKLL